MPCHAFPRRLRAPLSGRRAYSLLEVVASIGLVAATLTPSLQLVRDSMEVSAETDVRQQLAVYAVSQVEQQLAAAAATWATGTYSGDYSIDGAGDIRFDTVVSDDPLNGGIEDVLMDIRTTTYYDANGDDAPNADEHQCTFRTKLGRFATYEAIAP